MAKIKNQKSKSLHKSFLQVVAVPQMDDFSLSPFQLATFILVILFRTSDRFMSLTQCWCKKKREISFLLVITHPYSTTFIADVF